MSDHEVVQVLRVRQTFLDKFALYPSCWLLHRGSRLRIRRMEVHGTRGVTPLS